MLNEVTSTDQFVRKMLESLNLPFDEQGSSIKEVKDALKDGSKTGKGGIGKPEFVLQSGDFLVIVEDKLHNDKNIKFTDDNELDLHINSVRDYATNGAVHYARHISNKSNFTKIFAIGISGSKKNYIIQPVYVTDKEIVVLNEIKTLENLKSENIDRYYRTEVLNETPVEEKALEEIMKLSKDLHEHLRNYGQLSEQEKPLVVSAILLALKDENFSINNLIGNQVSKDGKKIHEALSNYLEVVKVAPDFKKKMILSQFSFIKERLKINEVNNNLGKTPLKYFAEFIEKEIMPVFNPGIKEDILGRFYGEFVSYTGGDGKGLGIVLTPTHITGLMCDLVELKAQDIVLDPCTGTAGFLVTAMHDMLQKTEDEDEKAKIKKERLHGIEIREDLYTIATTNMILRGDGKSNLRSMDFMTGDEKINNEIKNIKATVGLMNPPYSQSKGKDTAHLSELSFILKLLESLDVKGRCAVIVPQSTMIGKTKQDKEIKKLLLNSHTLEGVITMNKNSFYGVGTNTCVALFTAHVPHDPSKRVKFINFEDDGYVVKKHVGLVATELAKDRKKQVLDVYFDRKDAPNSFMVKSTVKAEDEWLHSFYYFNDEIPNVEDFKKTMADYLTFEFDMRTHGKGYLFDGGGE
jgi:type I restriction enzyme M protein